jgi:hypothetical protein
MASSKSSTRFDVFESETTISKYRKMNKKYERNKKKQTNYPFTNFRIHRSGIEPEPLAWKASMITTSPTVCYILWFRF